MKRPLQTHYRLTTLCAFALTFVLVSMQTTLAQTLPKQNIVEDTSSLPDLSYFERIKEPPPPASEVQQEQIAKLIKQLGDNQYKIREEATASLWKLGHIATPLLEKVVEKSGDPEVIFRAKKILADFSYGIFADTPKKMVEEIRYFRQALPNEKPALLEKYVAAGRLETVLILLHYDPACELTSQVFSRLAMFLPKKYDALIAQKKYRPIAEFLLLLALNEDAANSFHNDPRRARSTSRSNVNMRDRYLRQYVTFLAVTDLLDEAIMKLTPSNDLPPSKHKILYYLHRANGNPDAAIAVARQVGETNLLIDALLEKGDWHQVAMLLAKADTQKLGYSKIFMQRLFCLQQAESQKLYQATIDAREESTKRWSDAKKQKIQELEKEKDEEVELSINAKPFLPESQRAKPLKEQIELLQWQLAEVVTEADLSPRQLVILGRNREALRSATPTVLLSGAKPKVFMEPHRTFDEYLELLHATEKGTELLALFGLEKLDFNNPQAVEQYAKTFFDIATTNLPPALQKDSNSSLSVLGDVIIRERLLRLKHALILLDKNREVKKVQQLLDRLVENAASEFQQLEVLKMNLPYLPFTCADLKWLKKHEKTLFAERLSTAPFVTPFLGGRSASTPKSFVAAFPKANGDVVARSSVVEYWYKFYQTLVPKGTDDFAPLSYLYKIIYTPEYGGHTHEELLAEFKKVEEAGYFNPGNPMRMQTLKNLANTLVLRGRREEALQYVVKLFDGASSDQIQMQIAGVAAELELWNEVIARLEDCYKRGALTSLSAQVSLAVAYDKTGQTQKALAILRKVELQLGKGAENLVLLLRRLAKLNASSVDVSGEVGAFQRKMALLRMRLLPLFGHWHEQGRATQPLVAGMPLQMQLKMRQELARYRSTSPSLESWFESYLILHLLAEATQEEDPALAARYWSLFLFYSLNYLEPRDIAETKKTHGILSASEKDSPLSISMALKFVEEQRTCSAMGLAKQLLADNFPKKIHAHSKRVPKKDESVPSLPADPKFNLKELHRKSDEMDANRETKGNRSADQVRARIPREIDASLAAAPNGIELVIGLLPLLEKAGMNTTADALFNKTKKWHEGMVDAYPKSALLKNNYAWMLANSQRELDKALSLANDALKIAPQSAGYYDTLAEVYFRRGEQEKAVEKIQKAMELNKTATPRNHTDDFYLKKQLRRFTERKMIAP